MLGSPTNPSPTGADFERLAAQFRPSWESGGPLFTSPVAVQPVPTAPVAPALPAPQTFPSLDDEPLRFVKRSRRPLWIGLGATAVVLLVAAVGVASGGKDEPAPRAPARATSEHALPAVPNEPAEPPMAVTAVPAPQPAPPEEAPAAAGNGANANEAPSPPAITRRPPPRVIEAAPPAPPAPKLVSRPRASKATIVRDVPF